MTGSLEKHLESKHLVTDRLEQYHVALDDHSANIEILQDDRSRCTNQYQLQKLDNQLATLAKEKQTIENGLRLYEQILRDYPNINSKFAKSNLIEM